MNIQKNTDELLKILENGEEIEKYEEENKEELIDMDLAEYLDFLLKKYKLTKNNAINNSDLSQIYGYQIFSGTKKNPSRNKIIQLIFGMGLDITDAQRLMRIAGTNELYPRVRRDSIILYALNKKMSLSQCDELLFEMKEKTILNA